MQRDDEEESLNKMLDHMSKLPEQDIYSPPCIPMGFIPKQVKYHSHYAIFCFWQVYIAYNCMTDELCRFDDVYARYFLCSLKKQIILDHSLMNRWNDKSVCALRLFFQTIFSRMKRKIFLLPVKNPQKFKVGSLFICRRIKILLCGRC